MSLPEPRSKEGFAEIWRVDFHGVRSRDSYLYEEMDGLEGLVWISIGAGDATFAYREFKFSRRGDGVEIGNRVKHIQSALFSILTRATKLQEA